LLNIGLIKTKQNTQKKNQKKPVWNRDVTGTLGVWRQNNNNNNNWVSSTQPFLSLFFTNKLQPAEYAKKNQKKPVCYRDVTGALGVWRQNNNINNNWVSSTQPFLSLFIANKLQPAEYGSGQ